MNPERAIARYQQIQATRAQLQAIATDCLTSSTPTPLLVLQYAAWVAVDWAIATALAPSSSDPSSSDPSSSDPSSSGSPRIALACRAGCDWCCYLSVPVDFLEAIAIVQYLRQTASAPELAEWRDRTGAIATQLETIAPRDRLAQRIPCAFLRDHQCQIYPVRPAACRGCHATDAQVCEAGFVRGQWQGRSVGEIDFVAPTMAMALQDAVIGAGWPMGTLDLNRAIALLLEPIPPTAHT
jgi:Fe-S-cluster containining protein